MSSLASKLLRSRSVCSAEVLLWWRLLCALAVLNICLWIAVWQFLPSIFLGRTAATVAEICFGIQLGSAGPCAARSRQHRIADRRRDRSDTLNLQGFRPAGRGACAFPASSRT